MSLAPATSAVSERPTTAVETSSPTRSRWEAAEGKREVGVPLASLPAGVSFSADCPEPIRYDAAHKSLRYRGQMYHTNYMYLRSLSTDAAYGHAVDELFAASVPPDPAVASIPWPIFAGTALALLGIAGMAAMWVMYWM